MWFEHESNLSDSVSKVHTVLGTCLFHMLDYLMHCVQIHWHYWYRTDPTIETYQPKHFGEYSGTLPTPLKREKKDESIREVSEVINGGSDDVCFVQGWDGPLWGVAVMCGPVRVWGVVRSSPRWPQSALINQTSCTCLVSLCPVCSVSGNDLPTLSSCLQR